MVIRKKRYVIASKNFPLEFDDGDGCAMDNIEDAYFYESRDDAMSVLSRCFDEPDEYQVIEVRVSYEF